VDGFPLGCSDRHALGGFLFDVVELGRLDVKEHASSPHVRRACIHLRFPLC